MAKHKILKQKVYHDGTSMIVLKKGDSEPVPDRLLQTFIDEGVIAEPKAASRSTSSSSNDEVISDEGGVKLTSVGGGWYQIEGGSLDEPEKVQGREEAEARAAELRNEPPAE